jgi:hypothetical protein
LPNQSLPTAYFGGCASYVCNVDFVTITIEKVHTSLREGRTGELSVSLVSSDHAFLEGKSLMPGEYDTIVEFKL